MPGNIPREVVRCEYCGSGRARCPVEVRGHTSRSDPSIIWVCGDCRDRNSVLVDVDRDGEGVDGSDRRDVETGEAEESGTETYTYRPASNIKVEVTINIQEDQ